MNLALVKKEDALGATLLITGCCIGAGMIGLPVVSALAGLIPSTFAMLFCYFFATATGLLILEATLWFDQKVNLISITDFALGNIGKIIICFLFLFLFYCLFVAYIDGGGQLFGSLLSTLFGFPFPREIGILTCVSFVGTVVYAGTKAVANISRLFMLCIVISYCTLLLLGFSHINGKQLLYTNWNAAISTLPFLLVCFGYQNLIPTLIYYVKRDVQTMRFAIFVGNAIPFLIYFFWNSVILGILPETGSSHFAKMVSQNAMITDLLEKTSQSQIVLLSVKAFSFFAILTPFIVNVMAFVDFLRDGFKVSSESKYELFIYGLVLIPPTLLTLFYPHLFLTALRLVGGFADVLLFGILPALVVWIGRYVKKIESPYQVGGGKVFLSLILLISMGFLLITHLSLG